MDAIKFLKEKKRMCTLNVGCLNCPIGIQNNKSGEPCRDFEKNHPEDAVAIVEKWSAEHPIKTRQREFLKLFPNAKLDDEEIITICPKSIDGKLKSDEVCYSMTCRQCRKEYWLAEVE